MSMGTDEMTGRVEPGRNATGPYEWRLEQLERAGYKGTRAQELAARVDVDLNVACDLLAQGCPEETAFAILS